MGVSHALPVSAWQHPGASGGERSIAASMPSARSNGWPAWRTLPRGVPSTSMGWVSGSSNGSSTLACCPTWRTSIRAGLRGGAGLDGYQQRSVDNLAASIEASKDRPGTPAGGSQHRAPGARRCRTAGPPLREPGRHRGGRGELAAIDGIGQVSPPRWQGFLPSRTVATFVRLRVAGLNFEGTGEATLPPDVGR